MSNKKNNSTKAGLVFVGGLMLGMGFGFVIHSIVAGVFLGLGVGFTMMGLIWREDKE